MFYVVLQLEPLEVELSVPLQRTDLRRTGSCQRCSQPLRQPMARSTGGPRGFGALME